MAAAAVVPSARRVRASRTERATAGCAKSPTSRVFRPSHVNARATSTDGTRPSDPRLNANAVNALRKSSSAGRPRVPLTIASVPNVSARAVLRREFGARWGHFIPAYSRAKSNQLTCRSARSIDTGRPDSTPNASPRRAACTSSDRKASASADVRKVSRCGRPATSQRTRYEVVRDPRYVSIFQTLTS